MAHLEVSGNHYYSLLLIYLSVIFLLLIIICEQIIISLIKISNTKIMRFSYKPDKKAHHTVLHFTLYHICMICKAQAKKLVMIWMTADCIKYITFPNPNRYLPHFRSAQMLFIIQHCQRRYIIRT